MTYGRDIPRMCLDMQIPAMYHMFSETVPRRLLKALKNTARNTQYPRRPTNAYPVLRHVVHGAPHITLTKLPTDGTTQQNQSSNPVSPGKTTSGLPSQLSQSLAAAKDAQATPRVYPTELPPGNQLALQTPAKPRSSQRAGTMSPTPVSRAQLHISLSSDADAEGEPDPFHWRLGSELPHPNPGLDSPHRGKAMDVGAIVFDPRVIDYIKETTEGVMAPESQIRDWDSVPDVLGTIAHALAGVRDHMIVDVMDKDLRHDRGLWKYADVCLTDERLREDNYQPGKDPQVAEDVSPLVMISRIIGEINQLWTGIVDTMSHDATLFGPVIKEVAVGHTVLKQHGMLERYALLEAGFFTEAAKALGLTPQGVTVTIPEFFKDLVAKVDYVKEGVKFVSNQIKELEGAGTIQASSAHTPSTSIVSN